MEDRIVTRDRSQPEDITDYAPGITCFDVIPPLQYIGSDAVRRNFLRWFDSWESPIGVEIRGLSIQVSRDVAAAYLLH